MCITHVYIHLPAALLACLAVRWYVSSAKSHPPRSRETTLWGLLLGIMFLYKQNIAIVLSALVILLLLGAFRPVVSLIAALPIAYLVYRIYLMGNNIPFYNHEIQRYHQGVWILQALGESRIGLRVREALNCLGTAPPALW